MSILERAVPGAKAPPAPPPSCTICGSADTHCLLQIDDVPCQDGMTWPTREAAAGAPRGDIELIHCTQCSHIFNCRFDPSKLRFDGEYNISLHHSPAYRAFIDGLCLGLVDRHDLRGKTVVEIGCGKADFLRAICLPFGNRGFGFDPTFTDDCLTSDERRQITVEPAYYSAANHPIKGDLVTFRSMLQYMTDPRKFVRLMTPSVARPGGVVYAEVPDSAHTFMRGCVWNVVYEHGCFYSPWSIARLFSECGYHVLRTFKCWVEDQNLGIEATLDPGRDESFVVDVKAIETFNASVKRFAAERDEKLAYWRDALAKMRGKGERVAMWGAGARAQSFCCWLGLTDADLPAIVDINPHRHGRFMAKTLQQIVAPSHLKANRPDVVLITNSGYAPEIRRQIDDLGIKPRVMVL